MKKTLTFGLLLWLCRVSWCLGSTSSWQAVYVNVGTGEIKPTVVDTNIAAKVVTNDIRGLDFSGAPYVRVPYPTNATDAVSVQYLEDTTPSPVEYYLDLGSNSVHASIIAGAYNASVTFRTNSASVSYATVTQGQYLTVFTFKEQPDVMGAGNYTLRFWARKTAGTKDGRLTWEGYHWTNGVVAGDFETGGQSPVIGAAYTECVVPFVNTGTIVRATNGLFGLKLRVDSVTGSGTQPTFEIGTGLDQISFLSAPDAEGVWVTHPEFDAFLASITSNVEARVALSVYTTNDTAVRALITTTTTNAEAARVIATNAQERVGVVETKTWTNQYASVMDQNVRTTDGVKFGSVTGTTFSIGGESRTNWPKFTYRSNDPPAYDWNETGSKAVLNTDNTWRDLDCSSIVPAGAVAIHFFVSLKDDAVDSRFSLRKNGTTNTFVQVSLRTQVANVAIPCFCTVACDTNRFVEYNGDNVAFTAILISILGWE